MKIKHLLLAAALVAAVSACSADVTEPAARAAGPLNTEEEVTTTAAPDTTARDAGWLGSGGRH
jgi:ABC-type glycerol-3-phosphate transport system substrate-binding protein